ncbi:molybdopterin synthase catalytic subunit isoform X2 [Bactrocera dorsalis]|uniref:Molybdopterin synthase catalytic subunit n=1 Tax=Bactrocera dorsalis TaxID=27457 RepID=A0A8N4L1S0_BACDO|nr:molybdopterin synthase catalytic subunit isoform X2 [Bactrocera dorsalis]
MANFLSITREPLDVASITNSMFHEDCGAVSLFVGTTRNSFDGKMVLSLEYEAYETMALKELEKICDSVRSNWKDVVNIAIHHRLGLVAPKEASVVIAISSPHREDALKAVSYSIEHLKKSVPIWKKELYSDGDSNWKENKESCDKDNFIFLKTQICNEISVPNDLVQISVDKNEIKKRIACYLQKKRDEINQNNIIDYRSMPNYEKIDEGTHPNFPVENSCARVNTTVVKQDSSKCLLKVCRVKNASGPQIRPNYFHTLDKLMANKTPIKYVNEDSCCENISVIGKRKRLEPIEKHLFHKINYHLPMNLRLKQAEDRILRLESLSPEYWHFIVDANHSAKISVVDSKSIKDNVFTGQITYTAEDLNLLILGMHSSRNEEDI